MPGVDIGIRFERGKLPRLLRALPCLDGEESEDDGIDRTRNRDDDAAYFVVSDKISPGKTMVNEALADTRENDRSDKDRRKQEYGRDGVKEIQGRSPSLGS